MPHATVTYSDSHPVEVDRFVDALDGWDITPIELPAGGISPEVTDELRGALADSEALFLRPGHVTRAVIEDAPNLRAIAVHGSGTDHVDLAAATDHGVVVTHSPDAVGPSVVEHTLGMSISLLRGWHGMAMATADGRWDEAKRTVPELGQRTVGVVGLGTIGFDVATTLLDAFEADVLGYDPYVTGERTSAIWPRVSRGTVEDADVELTSFDDLFERADLVTLHVPLTDETDGLVGDAELRALDGDVLLNTSRGGVVDEAALARALDEGVGPSTVGLDVMEREPPEADDPLLAHSNVVVTPHVAGTSDGYLLRAATLAAEKIRAAVDGDRPAYVVNPAVFDS